jgi:hypothetical protein
MKTLGRRDLIQTTVRFVRARVGQDEVIDVLAVLIGSALSGEPTLHAFCERLVLCASLLLALFERHHLPHRSTFNHVLAAFNRPAVDALRSLFQKDLGARTPFGSLPGGLFDRLGEHRVVADVDGTTHAARQRVLPHTEEVPAPQGPVGRTRITIFHPFPYHRIGSFFDPGNGQDCDDMQHALHAITKDVTALPLPLSHCAHRWCGWYHRTGG